MMMLHCVPTMHITVSVLCSYVYRSCSRCPRTPRPKHRLLHFVYCCNTRHIYTTANNAIVSIGTHFSALLGIGIVQNFFFWLVWNLSFQAVTSLVLHTLCTLQDLPCQLLHRDHTFTCIRQLHQ